MQSTYPTLFGCLQGAGGAIVCLGAAYDRGSSPDHSGAALAPAALRRASAPEVLRARQGGIYDLGLRRQLFEGDLLSDLGDIKFKASQTDDSYLELLAQAVALLVDEGRRPLILGGDHSVTLAVLRGFARAGARVQVVQLDAHHDYEEVSDGELPTHSTFITHVVGEGLAEKVIQIGVRGLSWGAPHPLPNVSLLDCDKLGDALLPNLGVYLTVDVDAFDPMIAPAVHFPEPGGLVPADLEKLLLTLRKARLPVVGSDWCEYVPALDTANLITARFVLSGLAKSIETMGAAL
jgi:arginase family enzyme